MTPCRQFKPNALIARKAAKGIGVGVAEAVAGAEARIAPMKNQVDVRITDLVAQLQRKQGAINAGVASACDDLMASVDELTGLCGFVGQAELAKAAASLCKLLDGDARTVKAAAVGVDVDAIVLFARAPPVLRTQMAPDVLAGLERLVAPPPAPPASAGR